MKGRVLGYNQTTRIGVISGEDGKRYSFAISEWKGAVSPKAGGKVDFFGNGEQAEAIYSESFVASAEPKKSVGGLFSSLLGRNK